MKTLILLCIATILLVPTSCKSDDVLPTEIEILSSIESGIEGEFLQEPIVIKVSSTYQYDELIVSANQVNGNGYAIVERHANPNDPNYSFDPVLDQNYEARIHISLGCNEGTQTFEINLYSRSCADSYQNCEKLASTVVSLTASENVASWDRACDLNHLKWLNESNGIMYGVESPPFYGIRNTENTKLWKSTNLGDWSIVKEFDSNVYGFDIDSKGTLAVLTENELLLSQDGINWSVVSDGIELHGSVYSNWLLLEDSTIFIGQVSGDTYASTTIHRSRDLGQSWESFESPLDDYPAVRADNGSLYGISYADKSIYQSSNSGETWVSVVAPNEIIGDVKFYEADQQGSLFIVSEFYEYFTQEARTYLYRLDLSTNALSTVFDNEDNLAISGISIYDGSVYLINADDIYVKNNDWQLIEGPHIERPIVSGIYLGRGFNELFVNNDNEYVLSGQAGTYIKL